jgi:hypothetical protein
MAKTKKDTAGIRNTSKQYRKELSDAKLEVRRVENRIFMRAKTLHDRFPEIPIGTGTNMRPLKELDVNRLDSSDCLHLIEDIEKYLANKHPHKQLVINF